MTRFPPEARWWRQPSKGVVGRQHLYCARQGATTPLSGKAAVKPKNPRGESPVNLKNLFLPSEPARSAGRTGGAQGRSPGGGLNLGAKGASPLLRTGILPPPSQPSQPFYTTLGPRESAGLSPCPPRAGAPSCFREYRFPPQRYYITPSEPARSVGGTGAARGVSPMAA